MLATPGLSGGVLVGAAAKGEFDGDQRQRVIAHQPGLDAARAHHPLDGHGPRRGSAQARARAPATRAIRARDPARRMKADAFTSVSPRAGVSLTR